MIRSNSFHTALFHYFPLRCQDEDAVESAVVLLEIVGLRIHEKAAEAASIPALKVNFALYRGLNRIFEKF